MRNAFPGYTGARPRMQTWHGVTDTTLDDIRAARERYGKPTIESYIGSARPTTADSWTAGGSAAPTSASGAPISISQARRPAPTALSATSFTVACTGAA